MPDTPKAESDADREVAKNMGFHPSNRQKAPLFPVYQHEPLVASALFEDKRYRLGHNERITQILRLFVNQETREPLAQVMVRDLMGAKSGGGVDKERTIVAGDLVNADKMHFLHHLFCQNKQVEPSYFDEFVQKVVDPFDEKKKEKMVPKIAEPESETPGNEPEPVKKIVDSRTQQEKDRDLLFDNKIKVKN